METKPNRGQSSSAPSEFSGAPIGAGSRLARAAVGLVAGLAIGIVAGVRMAGLFTAADPSPTARFADPACIAASAEPGRNAVSGDALEPAPAEPGAQDGSVWGLLGAGIDLAARVRLLESTLEQIREDTANGPALVEQAIETMDEDELRAIIASTTRIGPDELERVQDVRAFSRRLSEIAMEGVVTPERNDDVPVGSVRFCPDEGGLPASWDERSAFATDAGRLYAVFDTPDYQERKVMVKWRARDSGEIALFQRYRVVPGADRSYVWYGPKEGWAPGEYQVDVYSGDESLQLVASGRYRVR